MKLFFFTFFVSTALTAFPCWSDPTGTVGCTALNPSYAHVVIDTDIAAILNKVLRPKDKVYLPKLIAETLRFDPFTRRHYTKFDIAGRPPIELYFNAKLINGKTVFISEKYFGIMPHDELGISEQRSALNEAEMPLVDGKKHPRLRRIQILSGKAGWLTAEGDRDSKSLKLHIQGNGTFDSGIDVPLTPKEARTLLSPHFERYPETLEHLLALQSEDSSQTSESYSSMTYSLFSVDRRNEGRIATQWYSVHFYKKPWVNALKRGVYKIYILKTENLGTTAKAHAALQQYGSDLIRTNDKYSRFNETHSIIHNDFYLQLDPWFFAGILAMHRLTEKMILEAMQSRNQVAFYQNANQEWIWIGSTSKHQWISIIFSFNPHTQHWHAQTAHLTHPEELSSFLR